MKIIYFLSFIIKQEIFSCLVLKRRKILPINILYMVYIPGRENDRINAGASIFFYAKAGNLFN